MNINKKRILKSVLAAVFMTLLIVMLKMPDNKESQINSYENLDWKRYSLYFLGIFVFYYLIDTVNEIKKKNKLKKSK
ncbi:hypothetical protein M2347_001883 [Chryseobacterium sp. H1D6B]|uniref:hypothetical protein n=1 Tax=Chryseobacterium sp. H1D6B TaxID=2940588 RepID=UPI0015C808E1|nr:hypothetical protein [Chryseobacterium sp. H1D6B]MDH6252156.1 hypothetical protein [Chryseobacterium sp. H1D6B]